MRKETPDIWYFGLFASLHNIDWLFQIWRDCAGKGRLQSQKINELFFLNLDIFDFGEPPVVKTSEQSTNKNMIVCG